MITLDLLDSAFHSVEIKNAAGQAIAIDGSGFLTSNINGVVSIDDNGGSLTVDATDLDIRGLNVATDSDHVYITDSTGANALAVDASGFLTVNANGDFNVTATDLDIRDLSSTQDSVEIATAAGQALAIDASGFITANINGTVTVSATDLDIRDLSASQDNVAISDGTDTLAIETDGSINVNATRAGFGSWLVSTESVTNTESELVSTPLTGRIAVLIQNLSSNDIYLKEATGVSTANGLRLPKGSSFSADLDADSNIFAIAQAGTNDIRVVEYAS